MIFHLVTFLSEGVTDTSAAQDLSQIWECRKHRIGWKMNWLGRCVLPTSGLPWAGSRTYTHEHVSSGTCIGSLVLGE